MAISREQWGFCVQLLQTSTVVVNDHKGPFCNNKMHPSCLCYMYGSNELTNPLLLFSQMTLGPTLNIYLLAPSNHVRNSDMNILFLKEINFSIRRRNKFPYNLYIFFCYFDRKSFLSMMQTFFLHNIFFLVEL